MSVENQFVERGFIMVELEQQRTGIATELRKLTEGVKKANRKISDEEKSKWEELLSKYDSTVDQIDLQKREKQITDREKRLQYKDFSTNKEKTESENEALSIQAWFRVQRNLELTEEHRAACSATGFNPNRFELEIPLLDTSECRALSAQIGASGAFAIERGFVASLEEALLAFGSVRPVAEIMRTERGNDMDWPTANDTGNKGELIGENVAVAEQDITLGITTWFAYKYSSKLIKVPSELLEDSAFDFVPILGRMLGERLGRITEQHYTTGTGANQPFGIVTTSSLGITTAGSNVIVETEILDLIHSVDPAYRAGPGVGFMMHDNTLLAIRKLQDSNGQFIWQPSMVLGEPDRLFGFPIQINQEMASSIATTNITILFGLLSKYKIRDVRVIRVRRLTELFAENDQEGFVSFFRTDGNLLDAGTNPIKHMIQV